MPAASVLNPHYKSQTSPGKRSELGMCACGLGLSFVGNADVRVWFSGGNKNGWYNQDPGQSATGAPGQVVPEGVVH